MDHKELNDETLLRHLCEQAAEQTSNLYEATEALADAISRYVRGRGESQCLEKS